MSQLEEILLAHQKKFSHIIPAHLQNSNAIILNFQDDIWKNAAELSVDALIAKTQKLLKENNAVIAIGRYAENRENLYRRSALFNSNDEIRSIHLGIDLTVPVGTEIYAPMLSRVHSFADNAEFGDYGPTIILQHELDNCIFYTLYGHLSRASLKEMKKNKTYQAGDRIAWVGDASENGHWPPHLHFQIIADMQGNEGNFPGVAAVKESAYYLKVCPDPNLILQLDSLENSN